MKLIKISHNRYINIERLRNVKSIYEYAGEFDYSSKKDENYRSVISFGSDSIYPDSCIYSTYDVEELYHLIMETLNETDNGKS